jgi:uncharacterized membrane protein
MSTAAARLRTIHPGWILVVLDIIGLAIASYLSVVELSGGVPVCGPLHGCETVATSKYAWIGPLPVAVYGVALSLVLLTLAIVWIRTDNPVLLDLHAVLSLVGVIFELYFLSLQVVVIQAVCVWCTLYGLSLILRFLVAGAIWLRRGLSARLHDSSAAAARASEPSQTSGSLRTGEPRAGIVAGDVVASQAAKWGPAGLISASWAAARLSEASLTARSGRVDAWQTTCAGWRSGSLHRQRRRERA